MPLPLSLQMYWCTAPADPADIADPGATLKAAGWKPGVSIPQGEHLNWLFWATGQLLTNNGALTYDDLADAIEDFTTVAGVAIEGTFLVDEYDGDQIPGTIHTDTDTGQAVISVDVSGRSVVYCENGQASGYAVERDTTTAIATYALTEGAATFDAFSRIITDGRYTLVCHHQYVECFVHETGVQVWAYDHGAQVYDIAMDGTQVYLVGEDGGAGFRHCEALTLAAGVQVWVYRHSAGAGDDLKAVATNGKQVFVAGSNSSYGSGATIRALRAADGFDAANEGGTGLDLLGITWDDVQVTETPWGMTLATDGEALFCAYDSTAARQLERRACADGMVLADAEMPGNVLCIAADQRYVFAVHAGTDALICFDKRDLSRVWRWLDPAAAGVSAVASDGCAVFAGCDTAARRLARFYRGNVATLYRRVDVADSYVRFRLQAVPQQ